MEIKRTNIKELYNCFFPSVENWKLQARKKVKIIFKENANYFASTKKGEKTIAQNYTLSAVRCFVLRGT